MKTWVRKTLSVGVLAAGALLFAPIAAQADTGQSTSGNNGIGNGSQIVAPISVPLTVAGIGLGILGEGNGFGAATTGRHGESGHVGQNSSDNNGILNGSQVYTPIDAPVTIAGVGLGVAGEGNGTGIASSARRSTEDGHVGQSSSDNNGILNGSQVYAPIEAPVTIAGVGAGVLGEGNGTGVVTPGAPGGGHNDGGHNGGGGWNGGGDHDGGWNDGGGHDGSGDVGQDSSGNNGIANGTQAYLPISVPINVAGVGLGVLGEGNGTGAVLPRRSSENGHRGGGHTGGGNVGQSSSDNNGIGNGSQVVAPVDAPVNVCGVGAGILGLGNGGALCAADPGHKPGHGDKDDDSWNGQHATDDQSDDAATSDTAATSDAAEGDAATSDSTDGDTTDGEAAEGDATEGDADTESTPVDGETGGSDTAGTAGSSLVGNLGGLLDTLR